MPSANPRARVAFRAAWSALIAWVLGSYLAIASTHVNHLMVALTCVISFATPMQQLGDTCRNGFIWVTSAIVLAPLGTATCYLCFLLGGMEWNHWVLAVGLGFTVLLSCLWSYSAAHLSAPRVQLAGNSATVVLAVIPIALALSGSLKTHGQLLGAVVGISFGMIVGSMIPLLLSHAPFFGAAAARYEVPRALAVKLQALADLCEAMAIYVLPTAAAMHRHRECRLRLLTATLDLQAACASASMELTELDLFPEKKMLDDLKAKSELCRRSLQMKSTMLAAGYSEVTLDLFFRGEQGDRLKRASVCAAHALRSSASYLLSLAGDETSEVKSAPWLGSSHASDLDCEEAADRCSAAWQEYFRAQLAAGQDPRWQERVEESMMKAVPGLLQNPGVPLDLFISGAHHQASSQEAARVAAFDEACRFCASLLGLKCACACAADMARTAATARSKAGSCRMPCFNNSFTGLRHWMRVPWTPSSWRAGWKKGGKFGCRLALATTAAALIFVALRPQLPKDEDGMWTLITVAFMVTPVAGNSVLRGLLRLLGTFLGALLAVGSVALGGSIYAMGPSIYIMAFFNKYFEPELQFAAMVNFTTYVIVLNAVLDIQNTTKGPFGHEDLHVVWRLATRRMVDVMLGVIFAMVANVFCFPERAVDELRARELTALQCAATGLRTCCRELSRLSLNQPPKEVDWEDLRLDIFASVEAMNFGGDGRAGVLDLLSDARAESRCGFDGGIVLGGALWIPCGGHSLPGQRCLQAVIGISRMLRITYMLVSLCEPGFEEGSDRPLAHDPLVQQALGPDGQHISDDLDLALAELQHGLEPQRCGSAHHRKDLRNALERLESRLELLFRGAAASRARVGGLVLEGALRSAAVLKLLAGAVQSYSQALQQLDGSIDEVTHDLTMTLRSDSEDSSEEDLGLCA